MNRFVQHLHRIWTRLVRVLSVTLAASVIVLCTGLLVLQLPFVQDALLATLVERVDSRVRGQLTVERMTGFVPFSVTAHEVRVESDGRVPMQVPELRVQLDAWDLLSGQLTLSNVVLIDADLRAEWQDSLGEFTLATALRWAAAAPVPAVGADADSADADSADAGAALSDVTGDSASTPTRGLLGDWLRGLQASALAPRIQMRNASLRLQGLSRVPGAGALRDSVLVEGIFGQFFLESRADRFLFEANEVSGRLPGLAMNTLSVAGQLFRDGEITELNGFRIRTLGSDLELTASLQAGLGVPLGEALERALVDTDGVELDARRIRVRLAELRDLAPGLTSPWLDWPAPLEGELRLSGVGDTLFADRVRGFTGNSVLSLRAEVPLNSGWADGLDLSLVSAQLDPADVPAGTPLMDLALLAPLTVFSGELKPSLEPLYGPVRLPTPPPGSAVQIPEPPSAPPVRQLDGVLFATQRQGMATLRYTLRSTDEWASARVRSTLELDSLRLRPSHLFGGDAGRDERRGGAVTTAGAPAGSTDMDRLLERFTSQVTTSGRLGVDGVMRDGALREFTFIGTLQDNVFGEFDMETITMFAAAADSVTRFGANAQSGLTTLEATGRIEPVAGRTRWIQDTDIRQLNISDLLPGAVPDSTAFSLLLHHDLLEGFPDEASGRIQGFFSDVSVGGRPIQNLSANLSITRDTLQVVAGALPSGKDSHGVFDLRTTLGDARFEGEYQLKELPSFFVYWARSLFRQFDEQLFTDRFSDQQGFAGLVDSPWVAEPSSQTRVSGTYAVRLVDLDPIRSLFPQLDFESHGRLEGDIEADMDRMSLELTLQDSLLRVGQARVDDLRGRISAQLHPLLPLRDSTRLQAEVSAASIERDWFTLPDATLDLAIERERVTLATESAPLGQDLHLALQAAMILRPDRIELDLDRLQGGRGQYDWALSEPTRIVYDSTHALRVDTLRMASAEQSILIDGTFSTQAEDSIRTRIDGLRLGRISDLAGSRLRWDGVLNGEIISRTPQNIPILQGRIRGDSLSLNGRPLGDLLLSSAYDPTTDRFNAIASLASDGTITELVNGIASQTGQDLRIQGYVTNPATRSPEEPAYDFEIDFRRIDLWLLEELMPNLLIDSRGVGTGYARIRDRNYRGADPDAATISARFTIQNASITPIFLNTTYAARGEIRYSERNGFTFDALDLMDAFGGRGALTGTVGVYNLVDDFLMDLRLDMQDLLFINNNYDPDLPFYATVFGTGTLELNGTQALPVLRTPQPIRVVPDSRVSVPLLDVTYLETDTRFVRFVEDFDAWADGRERAMSGTDPVAVTSQIQSTESTDFNFTERFTLDLLFRAEEPLNFGMIFDLVTNDAIYANGTGQIRITLQDEQYEMFGGLNILSGEYNFVSGDILARRFTLEEGGTITWEGNPEQARLDVSAVYRARPPISTLGIGSTAAATTDVGGGQRITIELVLQIFGDITQVQNEFFFRLPSEIAGISDPTLNTRINSLNRNQEEKLVQAFSILLTGNFIPSGQSTFEDTSVLSGLTGSAVLINPFVSTQLLSPLLSNQINSLLSENVTFDVDVNIDAYNEVELGVALRLYNDRLVLRREGQITGAQSNIGDLGATYAINSVLSVTAFHRQDPAFTSRSGQVSSEGGDNQVINGLGLQARFEFHSWSELWMRFSKLFAIFRVGNDATDNTQTVALSDMRRTVQSNEIRRSDPIQRRSNDPNTPDFEYPPTGEPHDRRLQAPLPSEFSSESN